MSATMPTHKFHIGQPVEFSPPRGVYAPRGPYVVTAKLPGLDGVFEYRIRGIGEVHERLALENELSAVTVEDEVKGDTKSRLAKEAKNKTKLTTVKQKRR